MITLKLIYGGDIRQLPSLSKLVTWPCSGPLMRLNETVTGSLTSSGEFDMTLRSFFEYNPSVAHIVIFLSEFYYSGSDSAPEKLYFCLYRTFNGIVYILTLALSTGFCKIPRHYLNSSPGRRHYSLNSSFFKLIQIIDILNISSEMPWGECRKTFLMISQDWFR